MSLIIRLYRRSFQYFWLALAVALVVHVSSVSAETLPEDFDSLSEQEQGVALLELCAEAIGGLERIHEVESISSLAEIQLKRASDPHGRPFTIIDSVVEVYPDKRVSYTSMPGHEGAMVSVLNGRNGWRVRDGEFEEKSDDELAESRASLQASIIPLLQQLDDPYYKVAYAGEEQIAGRTLHKLQFELPEGQTFSLYLDPDTYYIYAQHDFFGESPGFFFVGGYAEFDGLMFPTTAQFQGERGAMKFTLYWLKINADYDPAAFIPPSSR